MVLPCHPSFCLGGGFPTCHPPWRGRQEEQVPTPFPSTIPSYYLPPPTLPTTTDCLPTDKWKNLNSGWWCEEKLPLDVLCCWRRKEGKGLPGARTCPLASYPQTCAGCVPADSPVLPVCPVPREETATFYSLSSVIGRHAFFFFFLPNLNIPPPPVSHPHTRSLRLSTFPSLQT